MSNDTGRKSHSPWPDFVDREPGPLVSRNCIVVLSAVLMGMGVGQDLTETAAALCTSAGLAGMAAFVSLQLVAHDRDVRRRKAVADHTSQRLLCSVSAVFGERPASRVAQAAGAPPPDAGEIAMALRRRRARTRRKVLRGVR